MTKEVRLSASGMQRVCDHDHSRFSFIVGDHVYECDLFEASFLSPRVSRWLFNDCSASSLFLEVEDEQNVFENFMKLGRGKSMVIGESDEVVA